MSMTPEATAASDAPENAIVAFSCLWRFLEEAPAGFVADLGNTRVSTHLPYLLALSDAIEDCAEEDPNYAANLIHYSPREAMKHGAMFGLAHLEDYTTHIKRVFPEEQREAGKAFPSEDEIRAMVEALPSQALARTALAFFATDSRDSQSMIFDELGAASTDPAHYQETMSKGWRHEIVQRVGLLAVGIQDGSFSTFEAYAQGVACAFGLIEGSLRAAAEDGL